MRRPADAGPWRSGFVRHGGGVAGTRAVQMLNQVIIALTMVPVSESVNIPFVRNFLAGQQRPRLSGEGADPDRHAGRTHHLDSSAAAHPAARPGTRGPAVAGEPRLRSG